MRDHLIIYVNGKRHEIRGIAAFQSLSDFLRYDLGLTGTKVVCAEGDADRARFFWAGQMGIRKRIASHIARSARAYNSCISWIAHTS